MENSATISSYIDILPASSSFHTVSVFKQACNEMEFVNLASQRAIILAPIAKYCLRPLALNGFVNGYGTTNTTEMNKGIGVIADICRGQFGNRMGKLPGMDMLTNPMS